MANALEQHSASRPITEVTCTSVMTPLGIVTTVQTITVEIEPRKAKHKPT